MRYVYIKRMQSQSSYGLIGLKMRISLSFTKISSILLLKAQDYKIKHLWCAFRHNFNRTLSGTLAISLLGLMQHTMSQNMKIIYYLQSSLRTNGDMVSNVLLMRLRHCVLTFPIRCSCCLDGYIQWENRKYHFLCKLGQGRQPWGLACCHHGRLQPGTDQSTKDGVSIEPDLFMSLACALCDLI